MSEEAPHFDALLGGSEELPPSLNVATFAAYRSQEIQLMKNSLLSQSGTKLAFQTLPKHMRRRAMSHNVKRLPRRLRQIHLNQMKKSGMPAKQKRPSRKYRRRPRNLLEEYTKRASKKYKWLETHIWHAKRFHMVEKWGYKLACHPCDKAFRACYRATTQHCLLQDISYVKCVEVNGDKNLIVEGLKQMSRPNLGLSVGAKAFLGGKREGELTLFEVKGAGKALGTVNFHWGDVAKLWLWIHAAIYKNVTSNLIKCFGVSLDKEKCCYSSDNSDIQIVELAQELSRFRLIGPLANSILQDTFIVLDPNNINIAESWLKEHIDNSNYRQITENQLIFWKSIKDITSVSEISPHTVLSLIVRDPRLNLPKKRIKSVPTDETCTEYVEPNNISYSPLWDKTTRDKVLENKIETSKMVAMHSKLLVPGSDLRDHDVFIPIILIQRPGNKEGNVGLGSGWDIILPSAWAKPFWIAMVMRGARVGGLREAKSILFEMGKSQFLKPDTEAGVEEEKQISRECIEKFFKRPPAKRINYNKFSIASPLFWNWKLLIQEWQNDSVDVEDFVVLRDKSILRSIRVLFESKTNSIPELPQKCLIPVRLECEKRGSPLQFAIICLSKSKNDFKRLVMEPNCKDRNLEERKAQKLSHQVLLKKLKKRRKNTTITNDNRIRLAQAHQEELKNYEEKIRALWLPQATTIRNSCCREVIGFVRKGGFSYSHGKSFATGYIAAHAVATMVKSNCRNKVLFRNTNTRQYRVAKLHIIVE